MNTLIRLFLPPGQVRLEEISALTFYLHFFFSMNYSLERKIKYWATTEFFCKSHNFSIFVDDTKYSTLGAVMQVKLFVNSLSLVRVK